MSQSSFTILIVTYNSGSEISNLLNDLLLYAPGGKTIVIDNASRDETVALVQERFPCVQLIQNSTNLGHAARNRICSRSDAGRVIKLRSR